MTTSDTAEERYATRLSLALAQEQARGLRGAALVRCLVVLGVLAWVGSVSQLAGLAFVFEIGFTAVFLITGILHYRILDCAHSRLFIYLLFAFDIVLLAVMFSTPNPFAGIEAPRTAILQFTNFQWFFLFLAHAALSLEWRLVVWCGFWITLVRSAQFLFVIGEPGIYFEHQIEPPAPQALLDALWDPHFVSLNLRVGELLALEGVTTILAIAVARSKRLVRHQAQAERQRGALARYFSPNIVDHVIHRQSDITQPERRHVAVLFADIVGFTGIAERRAADEVVVLLRDFYARMAAIVFDHGGTLDKYLGDGLMASFNTPVESERPASQAIQCGIAMLADIESWNAERHQSSFDDAIQIGVGMHWGEAVTGDIGDERRLEFAVIGDAVNIAARFEAMTRELDCWLIVSQDLLDQAICEGFDLDGFTPLGPLQLRGRALSIQSYGFGVQNVTGPMMHRRL